MSLGQSILSSALAESTRRSYARVWRLLTDFANQNQLTKQCIPPLSSSFVFLFLTSQAARGIAGKSLLTYTSAISYVHKLRNLPDPTNSLAIRKLLIGAKRCNPSLDMRLPITSNILHKLVSALSFITQSNYEAKVFTVLYLTCFYGFFRVGELLPKSQGRANQVLQFKDLRLWGTAGQLEKISLVIKHAKNLEPGMAETVILHKRTDLCPVRAMQQYLAVRGDAPGPVFSLPGGSPLLRSKFDKTLHLTVKTCGLQGRYLGHSFRIGEATEAAAKGMSDSKIRQLGRWRSNAFLTYIRQNIPQ